MLTPAGTKVNRVIQKVVIKTHWKSELIAELNQKWNLSFI